MALALVPLPPEPGKESVQAGVCTGHGAMPLVSVEWPGRPASEHPQCVPLPARELHPLPWQRSARSQAFVPGSRGPPVLAVLSFEPVTWQQPSAAHTRMPED